MSFEEGWKKNGVKHYDMFDSWSKTMVLQKCGDCKFYQYKKDFSGDTPHICKCPSTDCESHNMSCGKPPSGKCNGFKAKGGGGESGSKPGGSKGVGVGKGLKTVWDSFDGDDVSGTVAGFAKGGAQIVGGLLKGAAGLGKLGAKGVKAGMDKAKANKEARQAREMEAREAEDEAEDANEAEAGPAFCPHCGKKLR